MKSPLFSQYMLQKYICTQSLKQMHLTNLFTHTQRQNIFLEIPEATMHQMCAEGDTYTDEQIRNFSLANSRLSSIIMQDNLNMQTSDKICF
jgi:hypothetical protein